MQRTVLTVLMLGLIATIGSVVAVRISSLPSFFEEPGAQIYLLQLAGMLVVYVVATLWVGSRRGETWRLVLRIALLFGLVTGALEALAIGIEDSAAGLSSKSWQIIETLGIFTLWAAAGLWVARRLKSIKAGLLASVSCSNGLHGPWRNCRRDHRVVRSSHRTVYSCDVGRVQAQRLDRSSCFSGREHA
jgi:hypothetical protein